MCQCTQTVTTKEAMRLKHEQLRSQASNQTEIEHSKGGIKTGIWDFLRSENPLSFSLTGRVIGTGRKSILSVIIQRFTCIAHWRNLYTYTYELALTVIWYLHDKLRSKQIPTLFSLSSFARSPKMRFWARWQSSLSPVMGKYSWLCSASWLEINYQIE